MSRPKGQSANMNVTPLIDVLLGAADHFHGDHAADAERFLEALVPQPPPPNQKTPPPTDRTIVVQLIDHGAGISEEIIRPKPPGKTLQVVGKIFSRRAPKGHVREGRRHVPFADVAA